MSDLQICPVCGWGHSALTRYCPATGILIHEMVAPGNYGLQAADQATGSVSNTVPITIQAPPPPHIDVTPTTVQQGTPITVTGSGFTPNGAVDIWIGGALFGKATADPSGALNVPVSFSLGLGTYTVLATDIGSTIQPSPQSNSVPITVVAPPVPQISASPTSVMQGQTLTINGSGFTSSGAVSILLNGMQLTTAAADATGTLATKITIKAG